MFPSISTPSLGVRIAVCLAVLGGHGHCGEPRTIELVDGSVLVGEIVTVDNGTYTVHTGALGTIAVKDADIVAIHSKEATLRPNTSAESIGSQQQGAQALKAVQERMLQDPGIVNALNVLKDDSEFQQILQDPEINKAVQNRDLEYLQANPKIRALMANPTIQEIYKNLQR